jgi:hypothetical protein
MEQRGRVKTHIRQSTQAHSYIAEKRVCGSKNRAIREKVDKYERKRGKERTPPDVGAALPSSAMLMPMHNMNNEATNQPQTIALGPPFLRPREVSKRNDKAEQGDGAHGTAYIRTDAIEGTTPMLEKQSANSSKMEKARLNSCL